MPNTVSTYLIFADLQMAAEAIYPIGFTQGAIPVATLTTGNNRSSKFTPTQAAQFAAEWEVVDHKADTGTGFSGTLFRYKGQDDPSRGLVFGQLVVSLRSTEFADDTARDGRATNQLEIRPYGWAFGQIADMKAWFDSLSSDPNKLKDKNFSVTGYSLGGHLATALNLLMNDVGQSSRIDATYTFNGAGVGELLLSRTPSLLAVIQQFQSERSQDHTNAFQTAVARQMYGAAAAVIRANSSATLVGFDSIASQIQAAMATVAASPTGQAEYVELSKLNDAVGRARLVLDEALRVRGGITNGGAELKPAVPTDLDKIESLNLDYQLAAVAAGQATVSYRANGLVGTMDNFIDAYSRDRAPIKIPGITTTGQGGAVKFFDLYGAPPPSAVANSQHHYGDPTPIFIEDQPLYRGTYDGVAAIAWGAGKGLLGEAQLLQPGFEVNTFGDSHSLVLLIDSLSIQNALATLDPNVDLGTLTRLLEAASSAKSSEQPGGQGKAEGDVLERTLDALRRMLTDPAASTTTANMDGGTWANAAARENFHQQLKNLVESPAFTALKGKVNVALSVGAELKASAKSDFAAFLALQALSPLVLKPTAGQTLAVESALAGGAMATVYSAWVADRNLTAAQRASGLATFSDRYYNDRADMLGAVVARNLGNTQGLLSAAQFGSPVQEQTVYVDATSQVQLVVGGTATPADPNIRRQIWFGGDLSESKAGSDRDDRLFGGGNNDTLSGVGGADWLEGHTGDDRLLGGAGNDTLLGGSGNDFLAGEADNDTLLGGEGADVYKFAGTWGADTVIDSDGQGSIEVAGLGPITGAGVKRVSPNSWQTPDRQVNYTLVTVDAGRIDLIITFADQPNVITIRNWSEAKNLGIINLNGAVEATPSPGLRELVQLHGIEGFGFLTDPVAYHIIGGTGENEIFAREFDDIVEGGLGEDEIHGGAGSDFLYAEFAVVLQAAIDSAMIDQTLVQFSLLEGDSGDDVMIGTNANYLYGGGGRDIMVGGGAADIIQGDTFDGGHSRLGNSFEPTFEYDASLGKMTYYVASTSNETTQYFTRSGAEAADGDDDTIYGGAGVDVVFGEMGDDLIDLGSGDDFGVGSDADDTVMGGSGDDEIFGDFNHDDRTPIGTEPDRLLAGWVGLPGVFHGDDVLAGDAGNDSIWGNGGNDSLYGGDGVDFLLGDDSITPDQFHGDDWIDGGSGLDTYDFSGSWGFDTVDDRDALGIVQVQGLGQLTGTGAKKIAPDTWQTADRRVNYILVPIDGTTNDLYISFSDRPDVITLRNWSNGLSGITLEQMLQTPAAPAPDQTLVLTDPPGPSGAIAGVTGSPLVHLIIATPDSGSVAGGLAADQIVGNGGGARLFGNEGGDRLYAGAIIELQSAIDAALPPQAGPAPTVSAVLEGGSGNDMLFGGATNWLYGGGERDTIVGGSWSDLVHGDTYNGGYSGNSGAITPNFDHDAVKRKYYYHVTQTAGAQTSTFARIGLLDANGAGDVIITGAGDDIADGELGDDRIELGAGADIGVGSTGSDTVSGDAGNDLIFGDFNADECTPTGSEPQQWQLNYAGLAGAEHGEDLLLGVDGNYGLSGGFGQSAHRSEGWYVNQRHVIVGGVDLLFCCRPPALTKRMLACAA